MLLVTKNVSIYFSEKSSAKNKKVLALKKIRHK